MTFGIGRYGSCEAVPENEAAIGAEFGYPMTLTKHAPKAGFGDVDRWWHDVILGGLIDRKPLMETAQPPQRIGRVLFLCCSGHLERAMRNATAPECARNSQGQWVPAETSLCPLRFGGVASEHAWPIVGSQLRSRMSWHPSIRPDRVRRSTSSGCKRPPKTRAIRFAKSWDMTRWELARALPSRAQRPEEAAVAGMIV